jgi:hypothetical protein
MREWRLFVVGLEVAGEQKSGSDAKELDELVAAQPS